MSSLRKSLYQSAIKSKNPISLANKRFKQDFEELLKKLKNRNYQESNDILTKILNDNTKIKASRGYIEIMDLKAKCLYFMREYREAELLHMNIVEYGKYNFEKRKESYGISDRYRNYCDLLKMLISSNLDLANLYWEEIKKSDLYSKINLTDLAQLDMYGGMINALLKRKDEAYYYYFRAINLNNTDFLFLHKVAHNIAIANDWFVENSSKESTLIEEELVSIDQLKNLSEYENHPLLEKKQKIMMQTMKKEDLKEILIGLLFSLNFKGEDNIVESIDDIKKLDDLIPNDIHTILCFAELLLSSPKLSTKEKGKQLLSKINDDPQGDLFQTRTNILEAVFMIDTGKVLAAQKLLGSVIQNESIEPWEDHYKVMAFKILAMLAKRNPDENEFYENLMYRAKEYEKRMNVPAFSNKLVSLQFQDWEHIL